VVFTWDTNGGSRKLSLTIDGSSISSDAAIADASLEDNDLAIGRQSGGGNNWKGQLDDIRIYDYALTDSEIQNLYRAGQVKLSASQEGNAKKGLVGYWSFNGPDVSGATAFDRSGFGNNGTINGAVPVSGKYGQGMSFDGVDDLINAGSEASLDNIELQGGGGLTISAWIMPFSVGENGGAIICKEEVSYNYCFNIINDANNRLSFQRDYATTDLAARSVSNSIVFNEWQNVVMVWDGGGIAANVQFFVNGIEKEHYTDQDGVGDINSDSDSQFIVGNSRWGSNTFDGKIDEVRIYNRTLSANEIRDLYNLGKVEVRK
jgi:hypothetical protein